MKVVKGETRIGIGSHFGGVLSYESFPAHLPLSIFGIVVAIFLSLLAPRDPWLFKRGRAGVSLRRGYYYPTNNSES